MERVGGGGGGFCPTGRRRDEAGDVWMKGGDQGKRERQVKEGIKSVIGKKKSVKVKEEMWSEGE